MKVSPNFDIREFVPKSTYDKWGENSTWFVNPLSVSVAEFYKSFFLAYYKKKNGDAVKDVLIVINNWHYGGIKQYSGYRPPSYTEGAKESQHRFKNAFDCEIFIVFADGTKIEVNYQEIHRVIAENDELFFSKGVRCIEDVRDATGWLHTDFRWTFGQVSILTVRA